MKTKTYWIILGLVLIAVIAIVVWMVLANKEIWKTALIPVKKAEEAELIKKLFIVHSYDSENVCGIPQDEGAVVMLEKLGYEEGKNLEIDRFFMDTKKTYTTPEQIKMRGEMAIAEIKKVNPDAILLLDDNAFTSIAFPLAKSEYQMVFCGMNGQIENYDKEVDVMIDRMEPGYNITGVLETVHYAESFLLLQKIVPAVKKVLVINDPTGTGRGFTQALKLEMEKTKTKFPVEVEFQEVKTYKEFQSVVLEADKRKDIDAILPATFSLSTEDGKTVVQPEITGWIVKNFHKPDIGLTFFLIDFGNLAGAAVDFPALGGQAATKVAEIFQGAKAGDLPIEEASSVSICVNLARADQLGVSVPSDVIEGADRVYTAMQAYPEYKIKK